MRVNNLFSIHIERCMYYLTAWNQHFVASTYYELLLSSSLYNARLNHIRDAIEHSITGCL